MIKHQQVAGKDHRSRSLNPAAKPFLPLHKNQHPIPSYSRQPFKPSIQDVAALPFQPMLHRYQPQVLSVYGYYNAPCINPVQVFVHPNQPQSGYYGAGFFNPIPRSMPPDKSQFFGYQLGQPSMGSHYFNSRVPSDSLRDKIVKQIEYYFSNENLPYDHYLISLMDEQGWVPIAAVAKFKRVEKMCNDVPFILDSLLSGSSLVEVQGSKIRRRRM